MRNWVERYIAGETETVWAEMMAFGPAIRMAEVYGEAMNVARETMRRVKVNAVTVRERLRDIGYKFQQSESVILPPKPDVLKRIEQIEIRIGPLPLSLRAFYEVVGSLDFRQSWKQLVNWHRRQGHIDVPEVLCLGEADPIVVHPVEDILDALPTPQKKLYFCFAPDEFHKANYSGGENYHLNLPNPNADAPVSGMYGVEETFVQHLWLCFRHGGFRGPHRERARRRCWMEGRSAHEDLFQAGGGTTRGVTVRWVAWRTGLDRCQSIWGYGGPRRVTRRTRSTPAFQGDGAT